MNEWVVSCLLEAAGFSLGERAEAKRRAGRPCRHGRACANWLWSRAYRRRPHSRVTGRSVRPCLGRPNPRRGRGELRRHERRFVRVATAEPCGSRGNSVGCKRKVGLRAACCKGHYRAEPRDRARPRNLRPGLSLRWAWHASTDACTWRCAKEGAAGKPCPRRRQLAVQLGPVEQGPRRHPGTTAVGRRVENGKPVFSAKNGGCTKA